MRALIESYERWMSQSIVNPFTGEHQSYRSLIYNQAQRLLKWFLGKEERFEGFPWDRVLGG
jgi:CRISPR/Cas system-associated endonuclease Cas1